ncbi:DUF4224 domain-containing protein [Oceanimonas smirnovii]|uniref:DUF4224 domain-containing protein n=1 Tax=Oceanimonas smirnovii TaxID=264574 RepID=UPI003FD5EE27
MATSLIVTEQDLAELTGYKRRYEQKECLDRHGIFYIEGSGGQIRTTWEHINSPLRQRNAANSDGFNLEAL